MLVPGGGLKQLDLSLVDTEHIFDATFSASHESQDSGCNTSVHAGTNSESGWPARSASVRAYSNYEDM
jgi:hypothetical protein